MAGRSDIQAGSAYVRLWVKNNEFLKGLNSAGKTLKSWGTGISVIGGAISAMGTGIVTSLVSAASHFADSGDEINKMSQRTGASVKALSELRYAAGQSGIAVGDLETGFKHMSKSIDEARQGSKEARETLRRLGITFDDLKEPPDAQMELFAERLSKIQDPSQRAALAMKVFGKSGTALLPLFADGAKGMQELRQEAVELGLSFGQDQADAATNLGDAWDRVKKGLAGAVFQIGGALAPTLTDLLAIVKNGVVFISDFVSRNREMTVVAAKVALGLVLLGGVITAVGVGFIGAGAVLTGFVSTVGTIAAGIATAIGILVSGPGLIAAAVAGGVAWFLFFTETGRDAVDSVMAGFWELLDIGKAAWAGIVNAIKAGDLELAGRIALAGLNLVWLEMTAEFKAAWIEAKFFFLNVWHEAQAELAKIFISAFAGIQRAWVGMTSFLESTWDSLRTSLLNGWQSLQKGIGNLIINAAEKSGAVSKDFAQAWRESLNQPIEADIAGREANSAKRQAEIEASRNASLGQIDQQEAGARGVLDQNKARAQQAAFDARQAALSGGQAAIDKARSEFESLQPIASEAAARAAQEQRKRELATGAGIIPPGSVGGAAAAGTFSAAAALALGGSGGVQERIAKINEQQKKVMEKMSETQVQVLLAINGVAMGLKH